MEKKGNSFNKQEDITETLEISHIGQSICIPINNPTAILYYAVIKVGSQTLTSSTKLTISFGTLWGFFDDVEGGKSFWIQCLQVGK